ncbi:MAG: hypothetical protein KDB03_11170 [Planctomycetales bacterium]|nr:hypothetical protein [Planctomycetales bacterium]
MLCSKLGNRRFFNSLTIGSIAAAGILACSIRCPAQESTDAKDIWISSLSWNSSGEILGTQSQGLLLRPAQVISTSANAPGEFKVLGETESSLWKILTVAENTFVSDYKGGVHVFKNGQANKFDFQGRWVRAMVQVPGSDELLVGTEDGKIAQLGIDNLAASRSVDAAKASIFDIAFNHAGDQLAVATGDGKIILLQWPGLEPAGELTRGSEAIWSIKYLPGDKRLISGGADRRLQAWDLENLRVQPTIAICRDWITNLVVLPETDFVLAGCMDGRVQIADLKSQHSVFVSDSFGSAIWAMALSPDCQQLAIGTRKHGIKVQMLEPWLQQARERSMALAEERPPKPH